MTTVHRLKATGAILGLAAVLTTTHVWGELKPKPTKGNYLTGRSEPPPVKSDQQLMEDLALTKFSNKSIVTYRTVGGDTLFALAVKPKLEAVAARPRDILIMVDTSASQARGPLTAARKLVDAMVKSVGDRDQVSIWTVNTPAATRDLTRGFQEARSPAVEKSLAALKQEVPFGDTDLKSGLQRAVDSFASRLGRQRVLLFLGDGMSLHNPISTNERLQLTDKMIAKEIGFFTVPLGRRFDSSNLHGFATGTGGMVVRAAANKKQSDVAKLLNAGMSRPILYTKKFELPAEVTEAFPTKLPPLRADVPTLVIGKIKPGETLDYTVEGTVQGRNVKVQVSEKLAVPEIDNFFLVGMHDQWQRGENRAIPTPFRADRALVLSFERTRLARDEFLAQANWAIQQDNMEAAARLFGEAKKLDPADADADAGIKIVAMLREGKITKKQLREQVVNPEGMGVRIDPKKKITRGKFKNLLVQAENRMPKLPGAGGVNDPGFPPNKDDFLRAQKQRLAVEEQRITAIVNDVERQANRLLQSDPDAAHELLKRTLASIRDNVDLSPQTRQNLLGRMEAAVRNVDVRGARIKQDLQDRMLALARAEKELERDAERQRGQEQITRRMKAFGDLMDQGRANEAYREALVMQQDTINRGLDVPPSMVAAYNMGLTSTHLREVQEIKRASEERYLLAMLQVDKSHIPFPDEPPVEFPPAATWRKLTERREKAGYESVGLGEEQGGRLRAQEIRDKLSRPVNLDRGIDPNTPLKDALEFLSDRYDLTIIIDSQAFEAIGVQKPEEQAVQLPKMVGVSLATVLRLLLAQVKGDIYSGTYLIRRDYIEVTTSYNAAAEKVVRAYPVADLVIPIPNSINQQALQQSLAVYGQFVNQSPAFIGGVAIGGGGFPGGVGGGGGALAGGALGGGMNPFGFGGNLPGNNQFGNLGGQFGLQGQTTERELMELIVKVVAPGEWRALGPNPNAPPGGPGALPGAPLAPPGGGFLPEPTVSEELLNSIGYYAPARALVVRASSRIHTRLEGGITARPGGPPLMGAINRPPVGPVVIKPNGGKPAVAGINQGKESPKDPKKPKVAKGRKIDPTKDWREAIAQTKARSKDGQMDTGLIIACADFLVTHGRFNHAAELMKAAIREDVLAEQWAFDALAMALELSNGSAEEIERAQLSAIDLEPQNAEGFLQAAKGMASLKRYDRAVALCRQAALMEPRAPRAYANALAFAEHGKDAAAMAWAASNLLRQEWPKNNEDLHAQAQAKLRNLIRDLKGDDASKLQAVAEQVRRRDLIITLTWVGSNDLGADLDLKVAEPIGTSCSFMERLSPGGGTLVGDRVADGFRESYVASEAFDGDYEITVERIWGRPLGGQAIIEIIRHQGTPQESRERKSIVFDRKHTLKVSLKGGRRTEVAEVPSISAQEAPINSQQDERRPDEVLNKLRALSDPIFGGSVAASGLRGGVRSGGIETRTRNVARKAPSRVAMSAKVSNYVNSAMDMVAQTRIVPGTSAKDRGEIRVRVNPVFLNRKSNTRVSNPIVPGGF